MGNSDAHNTCTFKNNPKIFLKDKKNLLTMFMLVYFRVAITGKLQNMEPVQILHRFHILYVSCGCSPLSLRISVIKNQLYIVSGIGTFILCKTALFCREVLTVLPFERPICK